MASVFQFFRWLSRLEAGFQWRPEMRLLSDRQTVGVNVEEVTFQHIADTQQKLCVDAGPVENLVDVRSVAAKLVGEPDDRTVLATELFLNKLTYKNLTHKKKWYEKK